MYLKRAFNYMSDVKNVICNIMFTIRQKTANFYRRYYSTPFF